MTYWFTSDYHLGHDNIRGYCERPFKSLEEMNETIIRNHNARVKPTDTVFFLGDFCFSNSSGGKVGEGEVQRADYYISRLNGRFVFIKGNHDNNNSLKTIMESAIIHLGGQDIHLCHKPDDYNYGLKLNFVGHVHKLWKFQKRGDSILVNVGCDVWNYMPIDFNEITKELGKWIKSKEVK